MTLPRRRCLLPTLLLTLAACTDAAPNPHPVEEEPPPEEIAAPRRLRVSNRSLIDPETNAPVRLRGANLEGADATVAAELRKTGFNFVRLRVSLEPDSVDKKGNFKEGTIDLARPSGLKAWYEADLEGWVRALQGQQLWILLEMRADDIFTNSATLYDVTQTSELSNGGINFVSYRRIWEWIARRYAGEDYIAGYGLLAEPSVNHVKTITEKPVGPLTAFQHALMDAITAAGDQQTPFFIGPDFNYDAFQFREDGYYTRLADYRGRLVYEANFLVPKPWIVDGTVPAGAPASYPQPPPSPLDFSPLITPLLSESFEQDELERIFNERMRDPASFSKTFNPDFMAWYLSWATRFSERHQVPVVVDQFGASTLATGQLDFERDLLEFMEANALHYARWSWNAGSTDRMLVGNLDAAAFYDAWLHTHTGP